MDFSMLLVGLCTCKARAGDGERACMAFSGADSTSKSTTPLGHRKPPLNFYSHVGGPKVSGLFGPCP